jgi:DNA-binding CsgD family transcriptional regulator
MSLQTFETDLDGRVDSLCVLGHAELGLGAPGAASQAFLQAFSLARRGGLRLAQLNAAEGLACASAATHCDAALPLIVACAELRRRTGAAWWPGERRRISMWLQRGLGRSIDLEVLGDKGPTDGSGAWDELAELIDSLPATPMTEPDHAQDAFTAREREVAGLLARGLSNRQIASRLAISVGTVRAHVEHILLKLGVHSRAQVALWALHEHRRRD